MTSRRKFLSHLSLLGLGSKIVVDSTVFDFEFMDETNLSNDVDQDTFWKKIRKSFPIAKNKILNFNSGSAGVMPSPVMNEYFKAIKEINSYAPYEVHADWQQRGTNIINRLARQMGASHGYLNLVRNTTEAINLILWGLPLKPKDEIIYANWDYPFVDYSLQHLSKAKKITLNKVDKSLSELSDEEIISAYENQITDKTKLLIITWITHREGMILPVKKICAMAKKYDVEVLVDGAHVVGQIEHQLDDIQLDYFASSLHKWLNAPLGNGILYIAKNKFEKLTPPISYSPDVESEMIKFDYLGTRAFQNIIGVEAALAFLDLTGIKKKEQRLKELTDYWTNGVKHIKGVNFIGRIDKACAIGCLNIRGIGSNDIKSSLLTDHDVHVKTTGYGNGKPGWLRISPNIYHDYKDLDRLVKGIEQIVKNK